MTTGTAGIYTFPRGIHPPERDHLAAHKSIEVLPTPKGVRIPLLQHLGAPCEFTLKPKDAVAPGDMIGRSDQFVSAPVHASIAGSVLKPNMVTLPNGRHVGAVPIKAADEQPFEGQALLEEQFGGPWPKSAEEIEQYEPKQIVEAIKQGGLVGMGGAAFPTFIKLLRNEKKPIQSLLINGCECEPYLTADDRLMVEASEAVVCGALIAARAAGADEILIGIEENKPEAIEKIRAAARGTPIQVCVLKTKYPQGGEKQLVLALKGREVPTGGLPLDVGVVVLNVGTAASVARAVTRGKAVTHRVVVVTGQGIKEPKNILAPVGVNISELLAFCGGLTDDAARVVIGGPMMGFTLGSLDSPVTKGTSGITVLTHDEVRHAEQTNCVRCGRCVQVCPLHLVPQKLALAARAHNVELARRYHINACMECGCCAYVCPASLPLVQLMRLAKIQVRADDQKAK